MITQTLTVIRLLNVNDDKQRRDLSSLTVLGVAITGLLYL